MKTEFKNFCKDNKMKFEGIKNDKFIASKLIPQFVYRMQGKGLNKEIAHKTRYFYIFDNTSKTPFDFSQIFTYREQINHI